MQGKRISDGVGADGRHSGFWLSYEKFDIRTPCFDPSSIQNLLAAPALADVTGYLDKISHNYNQFTERIL